MSIDKDKAVLKIFFGLLVQFLPLIILGFTIQENDKSLDDLPLIFSLSFIFLFFLSLVAGYIYIIRYSFVYIYQKGYPRAWGWISLTSVIGVSILLLLPDKSVASNYSVLSHSLFNKFNVLEEILRLFFTFSVLISFFVYLVSIASSYSYDEIFDHKIIGSLIQILFLSTCLFYLVRHFQKAGVTSREIIQAKTLNWKLIAIALVVKIPLESSIDSIFLYYLSFVFPKYVDKYIQGWQTEDLAEIFIFSISGIILAPLFEELFFRGLILHKWSIKWGVRAGVFASSIVFAIYHFRFDIFSLFMAGILYSTLYSRSKGLATSIVCHALYNLYVALVRIADFAGVLNSEVTSTEEYRQLVQQSLNQRCAIAIVSFAALLYFLKLYFPKSNSELPFRDVYKKSSALE